MPTVGSYYTGKTKVKKTSHQVSSFATETIHAYKDPFEHDTRNRIIKIGCFTLGLILIFGCIAIGPIMMQVSADQQKDFSTKYPKRIPCTVIDVEVVITVSGEYATDATHASVKYVYEPNNQTATDVAWNVNEIPAEFKQRMKDKYAKGTQHQCYVVSKEKVLLFTPNYKHQSLYTSGFLIMALLGGFCIPILLIYCMVAYRLLSQ